MIELGIEVKQQIGRWAKKRVENTFDVRLAAVAATMNRSSRALERDWPERYGIKPLLLETLVDRSRYGGGCYRAANWVELGVTAGRGRMDREHARHQASPKTVLIYPLARNVCRRLREG